MRLIVCLILMSLFLVNGTVELNAEPDTKKPQKKSKKSQKHAKSKVNREAWRAFAGKSGPTGWKCHVIQADPKDWGPDGINTHDFDGDGLIDVLVNYEEGKLSRLYFNPGSAKLHQPWEDFIEFKHGKCEDSGIGDLNNDGEMDYIANGGWVYFNPGKAQVKDASKWTKMSLFDQEHRIPMVMDVDGDGLNDLLTRGATWFKQPKTDKMNPQQWKRHEFTISKWPMNCFHTDMDLDGKKDFLVMSRKGNIFYVQDALQDKSQEQFPVFDHGGALFMTVADMNGDKLEDIAIAGGWQSHYKFQVVVLLRKNGKGHPEYEKVVLDAPKGRDGGPPKGIQFVDIDLDGKGELLINPRYDHFWYYSLNGPAAKKESWKVTMVETPGADTRMKMDNAYLCDMDGDGDQDFLTTEENGGWGVIWFENPSK